VAKIFTGAESILKFALKSGNAINSLRGKNTMHHFTEGI
jgi:hypothetical protein